MQYAVLIYESEQDFADRPGLMPAYAATTARLRHGERQVQDGPFPDSKEQLGGFFLIDVPDLDAALTWAARCPAAELAARQLIRRCGCFWGSGPEPVALARTVTS